MANVGISNPGTSHIKIKQLEWNNLVRATFQACLKNKGDNVHHENILKKDGSSIKADA